MATERAEDPATAGHRAALAAWRAIPWAEQAARMGSRAADRAAEAAGDRVRLGIWCPCLIHGGAETWQATLARSIDPARISLRGISLVDGAGTGHASLLEAFDGLAPVSAGRAAARALAEDCDVIVTWAPQDPATILGGIDRPPRVIYAVHLPRAGYGGASIDFAAIDHYAAVSSLALDAIPPGRPHSVISNAVDPDRLIVRRHRAAMLESWGLPDRARVAGFFQRFTHEKGTAAIARLAEGFQSAGHEDWHVVAVGEGRERAELARIKRDRGLDRLHLIAADPAAGDVLNGFDALIVASSYESFGLTMAEGLWMGVPVVSTPVGLAAIKPGLTWPIDHDATGPAMAGAVLAAAAAGPRPGSLDWARSNLGPGRFGREWSDLIVGQERAARLARVAACPDRGGVLGLSMQPDCGCVGAEVSGCAQGRGKVPGRVTLEDCRRCQA